MPARNRHEQHSHPYGDGEAFSRQGIPSTASDRRQSVGRRAVDGVIHEYRLLPRFFSAVVRDMQPSPTDFKFTVQIGKVRYKTPGQLSLSDSRAGLDAARYTHIPRGKNAGGMLVLPISDGPSFGEKYEIDIIGAPGGEEVKLELYTSGDKRKLVHEGTIDASKLTELDPNFDLDPTNPNNHGLKLSRPLSQLLYDFQIDQEPSEKQGKLPRTRRALGTRPASKPRPTISYDLSRNVETGLENKFLDLMQEYLELATALGPQDSVAKLNELVDQAITTYANLADAKVKRKIEDDLRKQLDDLQTTGFEHTVKMLYRYKKDNGEDEEEIGKYTDDLTKKFYSTKRNLRNGMILPLIELKRSMAIENFADYRDAWLKLFPRGPRTVLHWKPKWEKAEASGNRIELAEISEELRDELGKKLIDLAHDYLEEVYILNIDTGMPADQAEQKLSSQEIDFKSSPLSIKIEKIRELQDRANVGMALAFPLNLRLAGLLMGDNKDETMAQLNNDFNNAPYDGKVRISRALYKKFKLKLDTGIVEYAKRVHITAKEKELVKVFEDWNISKIKAGLRSLPRSEQLRIITSGEII